MNRKGFLTRLLAALGVGTAIPGSLSIATGSPPSPPAPPLVTSGYLDADFGDSDDNVTYTVTSTSTSDTIVWVGY